MNGKALVIGTLIGLLLAGTVEAATLRIHVNEPPKFR